MKNKTLKVSARSVQLVIRWSQNKCSSKTEAVEYLSSRRRHGLERQGRQSILMKEGFERIIHIIGINEFIILLSFTVLLSKIIEIVKCSTKKKRLRL